MLTPILAGKAPLINLLHQRSEDLENLALDYLFDQAQSFEMNFRLRSAFPPETSRFRREEGSNNDESGARRRLQDRLKADEIDGPDKKPSEPEDDGNGSDQNMSECNVENGKVVDSDDIFL